MPESLQFESKPYGINWRFRRNLEGYGLDRRSRVAGGSCFCVAARPQTAWVLLLYLVAVLTSSAAQIESTTPTVETIIARMAQARAENRARLRPYIVTRNYKLYGREGSNSKSEVIAAVAFVPPNSKKYTIQETKGSGLGQMIVRRMLASEAEVTKEYSSTDLSPGNYDFRSIREADLGGQRCYVLELLPKRKDKHLLRGDIWIDARTFLLRRFEGELARPPSWWLREVSLTFVYGSVSGMWLQTASQASANVRILGRSKMVSHDVKYEIDELVAAGSSGQTGFLRRMPKGALQYHEIPGTSK